MTGLLELELAGERLIPAEALTSRILLDSLTTALEQPLAAYSGVWVEKKPFGFTVHYRQLARDRIKPLQAQVMALLNHRPPPCIFWMDPWLSQVVPAIKRDKGTALRTIAAHGGAGPATVLYAGDAGNDASALAAATELGGIALGIGPEPPAAAEYRLPDPAALHKVLARLAEALTDSRITLGIRPY